MLYHYRISNRIISSSHHFYICVHYLQLLAKLNAPHTFHQAKQGKAKP